MASQSSSYKVFRIGKDDESSIASFARKYRDLRLAGLKLSPESFSSTFDIEAGLSDAHWVTQLTRPEFETFICAAVPLSTATDAMHPNRDEVEWVAQISAHGPISPADFELPAESGQLLQTSDDAYLEERWQIMGLYVHPHHRGHGIAFKLCDALFAYLQNERLAPARPCPKLHLRAMIKPDNIASIRLFGKLGFGQNGRCKLAEALEANGESAPEESLDPKYATRSGWIMHRTVDRSQ